MIGDVLNSLRDGEMDPILEYLASIDVGYDSDGPVGRLGGKHVNFNDVGAFGTMKLIDYGRFISTVLSHNVTSGALASVRANTCVYAGRWMYECVLNSSGLMQIGFSSASSKFTAERGVGDVEYTYSFDGCRCKSWAGSTNCTNYGTKWEPCDVLGCLIDCDAGHVSFTLNGRYLGVAADHVRLGPGCAYYPACSLSPNQSIAVNFGQLPFRHPVVGYEPFQRTPRCELRKAALLFDCLQRNDIITSRGSVASAVGSHLAAPQDRDISITPVAVKRKDELLRGCWAAGRLVTLLAPVLTETYVVAAELYPRLNSLDSGDILANLHAFLSRESYERVLLDLLYSIFYQYQASENPQEPITILKTVLKHEPTCTLMLKTGSMGMLEELLVSPPAKDSLRYNVEELIADQVRIIRLCMRPNSMLKTVAPPYFVFLDKIRIKNVPRFSVGRNADLEVLERLLSYLHQVDADLPPRHAYRINSFNYEGRVDARLGGVPLQVVRSIQANRSLGPAARVRISPESQLLDVVLFRIHSLPVSMSHLYVVSKSGAPQEEYEEVSTGTTADVVATAHRTQSAVRRRVAAHLRTRTFNSSVLGDMQWLAHRLLHFLYNPNMDERELMFLPVFYVKVIWEVVTLLVECKLLSDDCVCKYVQFLVQLAASAEFHGNEFFKPIGDMLIGLTIDPTLKTGLRSLSEEMRRKLALVLLRPCESNWLVSIRVLNSLVVAERFGSTNNHRFNDSVILEHVYKVCVEKRDDAIAFVRWIVDKLNGSFSAFLDILQTVQGTQQQGVFKADCRQLELMHECFQSIISLLHTLASVSFVCVEPDILKTLIPLLCLLLQRAKSNIFYLFLVLTPSSEEASGEFVEATLNLLMTLPESCHRVIVRDAAFKLETLEALFKPRDKPEFSTDVLEVFSIRPFGSRCNVENLREVDAARLNSFMISLREAESERLGEVATSGRVSEEELCPICCDVGLEVTFVPCGHRSCNDCITQHMRAHKECFFCKTIVDSVTMDTV